MLKSVPDESGAEYEAATALLLESRTLQFTFQMTTGLLFIPIPVPDFEEKSLPDVQELITFNVDDSIELSKNILEKLKAHNVKIGEFLQKVASIGSSKMMWTSECHNSVIDALNNHVCINKSNIEILKRYQKSVDRLSR